MTVYICAVRLKDTNSHCPILYWLREIVAVWMPLGPSQILVN